MSKMTLNLVERGKGEPAIVLIHGFTCNLDNWRAQLSDLSDNHRCLAVDLPGHGNSPAPAEASIEALAQAVNDTLETLQLNQVVLVGHSMGCRVATQAFSQSPARVAGIVHVDGSSVASGDADEAVRKTEQTLERIGMDRFLAQLYAGFYVDSTPNAIRDELNARLTRVDLQFARKLWLNLVRWDASRSRTLLASIDVPLLVIQSTYLDAQLKRVSLLPSQTTPWLDEIKRAVKNARVAIVPGVGHFPMLEAPQQTNEIILNFVSAVAPKPDGSARPG